jgi:hypothetical protein
MDSPATRDISRLIYTWDIRGLVEYELVYSSSDDVTTLRHLRQILAYFQKRVDLDIGVDREAVAFQKFEDSERLCAQTNDIFQKWRRKEFYFPRDVNLVLYKASQKIAAILGDVPNLDTLNPRFGPGATTNITKREASARRKLAGGFVCSEDLLPMLVECLEEMPGWIPFGESDSAVVNVAVRDGTLRFVPKSAKTDRAIVVEPVVNSMYQLAIGDHLARLLRRVGVDITDQTRNQTLAREGSITGALATLDLSSASDTVARELVAHLLPLDWFFFLDYFRTGSIQYNGQHIRLQKFSSMGNGFTFPLETLIFFALAASCCEGKGELEKVSVYGDDIIIPSNRYELLVKVLRCVGFIPNASKSFSSGPFRESCGKDYFLGFDIRPSYIKDALSGEDAFVLHNYFVRTWQPEPASLILAYISEPMKIFGPDGYGDGHLLGDWIPHPCKREWGWCGYTFETFINKPVRKFRVLAGDSVLPSYSIYMRGELDLEPPERGFHPSVLRKIAARMIKVPSREAALYDRKGRLGDVLPGSRGFKKISIYTFKTR